MNKNIRRELLTPSSLTIRERENGEKSRTIEGYAILFDTPSDVLYADERVEVREVIAPEAVTRELLDKSDIKFTMFHDRQLILARSNKGSGTLSYEVDEKGVKFSFDAPETADGDKALSMVGRGDCSGCSFAFSTFYYNREYVEREEAMDGDIKVVTYRVKTILGIHDFTLAIDPAYPDTSVDLREIIREEEPAHEDETPKTEKDPEEIRNLRRLASASLL